MKRFIVIFTILVILCTLFISVSADSMSIIRQPSDLLVGLENNIYSFTLTFLVDNATSYQWYYSIDNLNWSISTWETATTDTLDQVYSASSSPEVRFYKCVASNSEGETITSRIATVEFVKSRFQYYSTTALRYVTRWVGSVFSSLTDGPLSGLLPVFAIGIAVAALLLAVKIVKLFSWGA